MVGPVVFGAAKRTGIWQNTVGLEGMFPGFLVIFVAFSRNGRKV